VKFAKFLNHPYVLPAPRMHKDKTILHFVRNVQLNNFGIQIKNLAKVKKNLKSLWHKN
jgi:hypothetical protein